MGQKSNPIGLRLPVTRDWRSKWYAPNKDFGNLLVEDQRIRRYLKKKLESASVPRIQIERAANRCRVTIFTARPGVVIGRKGAEIDKIKEELSRLTGKETFNIPTNGGNLKVGQPIDITTDTGKKFQAKVRIDTEPELAYFQNGGILHYVLRKLMK